MRPRTLVLLVCTAFCSISNPARSTEMVGRWKIDSKNGPSPTCELEQVGTHLVGWCMGPNARGRIIGTIGGRDVRLRWEWVTYVGNSSGGFEFIGTVQPDDAIRGSVHRTGTTFALDFVASRQETSRGAAPFANPNGPATDPDQQLMDVIERRAARLFPWASQGDQRTQYIIDEMNAAADRRHGNSYSIRVR